MTGTGLWFSSRGGTFVGSYRDQFPAAAACFLDGVPQRGAACVAAIKADDDSGFARSRLLRSWSGRLVAW